MHSYYADWKFKHPYPEDYFRYLIKYSKRDISWYTHDVFRKTGTVDYAASIIGNDAVFINYGSLTIPFEAAFYDGERNEISRLWFENVGRVKSIPLPEGTKSIIIDPDETLPDSNRPNNATSKPFALTWVFDQPQYYKHEIFWMPWLFSGNHYNGWTPGLNFYHGFVPGYDYGIGIRPMWDFQNEQLIGAVKYMYTFYGWGNFYTSTIKMDISRNSGRAGAHLEFEGKRKKHLQKYPVWSTTISIDYHNILEEAVDPSYYRFGEVTVLYEEIELHHRPNPFLNYYLRTGLKIGIQNSQFLRIHMQANIYYNFTKKIKTKLRIWAGGFIDDDDIPQQYHIYLSGNIDPDFRKNFLFNRTADVNDISIGSGQYDIGGPSIHGVVLKNNKMLGVDKWVISANFDITVPKLPGKPFVDLAVVKGEDPYIDLGVKKSFGPIAFIIPLYQSWDDKPLIENEDWLLDRIRIQLNVSSFNFRNLF